MKNKGFTLIEIIVSMAVILIISGGYIGFTRFSKQQTLTSAYENLRNSLNEAKSSALSQVIYKCTQFQTLVGYQIRFNNLYSYSFEEVCKKNDGSTVPNVVRTVPLPPDVRVSSTSNPVLFLVLSGKVQGSAVITITNGVQTKYIYVTSSGAVQNSP